MRILVVDDDPDMVETSRIVLEKAGYTVESASGLEEGLAKLADTAPDLLILDVMMAEPDDGLLFARRARRAGFDLPILMLTSVNQALGVQIGKDEEIVPVDEFVEKPVDPAVLVAKVKALLKERG